jgi:hypothetical protein
MRKTPPKGGVFVFCGNMRCPRLRAVRAQGFDNKQARAARQRKGQDAAPRAAAFFSLFCRQSAF